jgi:RNA polymerase sigma factor (sigma-70 family)
VSIDDYWLESAIDDYKYLCESQYHKVIRFVIYMGASHSDAQDAAQEAFCEALSLARNKPDEWLGMAPKAKQAWIRTVASRRYLRPAGPRVQPLTVTSEIPDRPAPGPGHATAIIEKQEVLRALRSLPEEERSVAAFDIDDIPTADIARELDISEQRVRDIRKKYRAKLKRDLGGKTDSGRRQ